MASLSLLGRPITRRLYGKQLLVRFSRSASGTTRVKLTCQVNACTRSVSTRIMCRAFRGTRSTSLSLLKARTGEYPLDDHNAQSSQADIDCQIRARQRICIPRRRTRCAPRLSRQPHGDQAIAHTFIPFWYPPTICSSRLGGVRCRVGHNDSIRTTGCLAAAACRARWRTCYAFRIDSIDTKPRFSDEPAIINKAWLASIILFRQSSGGFSLAQRSCLCWAWSIAQSHPASTGDPRPAHEQPSDQPASVR